MTKPFLVTGCGRSGTAWAAQFFTQLGFPCGHEKVFNTKMVLGDLAAATLSVPESSWMAAYYLDYLPHEAPVIRVMRDPYLVVQSAMARGFLADLDEPYAQFVRSCRPAITRPDNHLGRVIRWVALWDSPVDDVDHFLLRVEGSKQWKAARYATKQQVSVFAVVAALDDLGTSINTNFEQKAPIPTREQINEHPDSALLRARAGRFGYGA
jgi:hypothetical protein